MVYRSDNRENSRTGFKATRVLFELKGRNARRHARNCRESRVHPRSVTSVPLLVHASCASRWPCINMVHPTLANILCLIFALNAQINTTTGRYLVSERENKLWLRYSRNNYKNTQCKNITEKNISYYSKFTSKIWTTNIIYSNSCNLAIVAKPFVDFDKTFC